MYVSSLIRHLDASLKTQVVEGACFESLEFFQGFRLVREQVQTCLCISCNLDLAAANAVIDPKGGHPQFWSDLGNGQASGNVARVGLAAFLEDAVLQADGLHCAG